MRRRGVARSTPAWPPRARHELPDLEQRPPPTRSESPLWREDLDRYHYLGFAPLAGSTTSLPGHQPTPVTGSARVRGLRLEGGTARSVHRLAPQKRQARLHLVVNNARFLILPCARRTTPSRGRSRRSDAGTGLPASHRIAVSGIRASFAPWQDSRRSSVSSGRCMKSSNGTSIQFPRLRRGARQGQGSLHWVL